MVWEWRVSMPIFTAVHFENAAALVSAVTTSSAAAGNAATTVDAATSTISSKISASSPTAAAAAAADTAAATAAADGSSCSGVVDWLPVPPLSTATVVEERTDIYWRLPQLRHSVGLKVRGAKISKTKKYRSVAAAATTVVTTGGSSSGSGNNPYDTTSGSSGCHGNGSDVLASDAGLVCGALQVEQTPEPLPLPPQPSALLELKVRTKTKGSHKSAHMIEKWNKTRIRLPYDSGMESSTMSSSSTTADTTLIQQQRQRHNLLELCASVEAELLSAGLTAPAATTVTKRAISIAAAPERYLSLSHLYLPQPTTPQSLHQQQQQQRQQQQARWQSEKQPHKPREDHDDAVSYHNTATGATTATAVAAGQVAAAAAAATTTATAQAATVTIANSISADHSAPEMIKKPDTCTAAVAGDTTVVTIGDKSRLPQPDEVISCDKWRKKWGLQVSPQLDTPTAPTTTHPGCLSVCLFVEVEIAYMVFSGHGLSAASEQHAESAPRYWVSVCVEGKKKAVKAYLAGEEGMRMLEAVSASLQQSRDGSQGNPTVVVGGYPSLIELGLFSPKPEAAAGAGSGI